MGMCPAATGILEYYIYYLKEKEKLVTLFLLFFNNGLVGKQERTRTKQHLERKSQRGAWVA